SGNGGRAGSLAADTTYHVFLIKRDSDDAIDAGFDTSLTASNLLTASSFDYYRRIGSVKTQAGNTNLVEWTQFGNRFYLDSPVTQFTTISTTAVTETIVDVPEGKSFRVGCMLIQAADTDTNKGISIHPVGAVQTGRTATVPAGWDLSQASAVFDTYTDTSAQVDVQMSVLGVTAAQDQVGACLWYEDEFDTGT